MSEPTAPTVGDLFCGAGGFSEGFRQAGFKLSWAMDNWKPAYTTFEKNQDLTVITDDIMGFDFRKLPRVDVLIGSPPCQPFSLANRGGNGDAAKGLELVAKFLDAVKALTPKYWIMENVANLKPTLEQAWKVNHGLFTKEDVTEYFAPEKIKLIDCSMFGVPQKRRRLFSGDFPLPSANPQAPIPMQRIVDSFPPPLTYSLDRQETMMDPLYNIEIRTDDLTDHDMDTILDAHQIRNSKYEKKDHSWAGKMDFPDNPNLPCRTICATSQKSGRQAIVIRDSRMGKKVFRTPTLRECATFQGFPITYQFWGSRAEKQTLIGNAVPPPVARALAEAIRLNMRLPEAGNPSFALPRELPPPLTNGKAPSGRYRFPISRRYHRKVHGMIASCRVELDNQGSSRRKHLPSIGDNLKEWRTVLYLGYAREYAAFKLDFQTAREMARIVLEATEKGYDAETLLEGITRDALRAFRGVVPDATTLQAAWANRRNSVHGPDWIVLTTGKICKAAVGRRNPNVSVEAKEFSHLLKGRMVSKGKDWRRRRWKQELVTPYVACSAVVLSVATVLANEGVSWLEGNWESRYAVDPATVPFPQELRGSRDDNLFPRYVVA